MTHWATNMDAMWEEPSLAAYMERLASFCRVICYDKRGSGVSDPVALASLPTIEEWTDDARAVMDAVGVEQAALLGDTEGGPLAATLAASHPDRVESLVLVNSFARWRRADDYDRHARGHGREAHRALRAPLGRNERDFDLTAPSMANDPRFRSWWLQVLADDHASPGVGHDVSLGDGDRLRSVLSSIRVPTLVLHRSGNRHHRVEFGRYLADQIPDAKYVELPGADSFPFHAGDFAPSWTRSRSS